MTIPEFLDKFTIPEQRDEAENALIALLIEKSVRVAMETLAEARRDGVVVVPGLN